MSPKHIIRAKRRYLQSENKKFSKDFVRIPTSEWPAITQGSDLIDVYRNREFLVQVFNDNDWIRISVIRTNLNKDGEYSDGITWDELQAVKAGVGYADFEAVEIYPKNCDVVNVANMRHLFIVDKLNLPFIWKKKSTITKTEGDNHVIQISPIEDSQAGRHQ